MPCVFRGFSGFLLALLAIVSWVPVAPAQETGKVPLAIAPVKLTEGLEQKLKQEGQGKMTSALRVTSAMDAQLSDALFASRKFDIIARSDVEAIFEDQRFQSVYSDSSDPNTPEEFELAGAKYLLVLTVDDFEDRLEDLLGAGGQVLASKRQVRFSAVTRIWDMTTGKLKESVNLQVSNRAGGETLPGVVSDTPGSDDLLVALSREMSFLVANRVTDVIFPAKVLSKRGEFVMVNRGDGTGIAPGQRWEVMALGEELVDPDTGEVLGSEEYPVGMVEVVSVQPKFSRARILEDYGIDTGMVLRLPAPGR